MKQSEIMRMQAKIGVKKDGFWGPISIAACQTYLREMMPSPARFPVEGSPEFLEFFGPHGEDGGYTPPGRMIELPFTIYYGETPVSRLSAHEKCADSLLQVFLRLAEAYPDTASREAAGILVYDGLYNPRLKRNTTNSWSMHAWRNAIDLNAGRNGNGTSWPARATMPLEVMECFAREGWTAAGAFWGRDAMHFQATLPATP